MSKRSPLSKEIILRGYPICAGIAIGNPFFFTVAEENVPEFSIPDDQIEKEVARYYCALKRSQHDLQSLQKRFQGTEAALILGAHLEMMRDPLMTTEMEDAIRKKGKNTEYVFKTVIGEFEKKYNKITDEFFRERLKDFQAISRRVIGHLRKHERYALSQLNKKCIVFAHELSPADTAEANTKMIEAFVTQSGAKTSHVAIMARAQGIPFVSNVDFSSYYIALPPVVIVNGHTGEVILNPLAETIVHFEKEKKDIHIQVKVFSRSSSLPTQTKDGHKARLSANIEMFNEIDLLHQYGGDGVGLFRSEYLFLAQEAFPTEEEQFMIYRTIVENIEGNPAVIRTFDIGGDKLGNFSLHRYERNPNLGCRAIRLMLKERTIFKSQLRAILRASAFGDVGILFPMISGIIELREAKALVQEAKEELLKQGIPYAESIPIGCMIEVPSAAITSDILAKECDFFSIGTNDLVQYALAVDRGNPAMSYLYTPAHPSIIRLIKMVVDEGIKAKRPVSICGEVAADPRFTLLLLGMGVNELSVSSPALPIIKDFIRRISIKEAALVAEHVLTLTSSIEVEAALEEAYRRVK